MTLEEVLETARQMIAARRWREAESACRQVLAVRPTESRAIRLLGLAQATGGQLASGIELFQQAVTLNPNMAEWRVELAELMRVGNRLDESAEQCQIALRLQPKLFMALMTLGVTQAARAKLEDAAIAFGQAVEMQPRNPHAWNNMGNIRLSQRRLAEAIDSYSHAIELQPDFISAMNNLAIALQFNNESAEALKWHRKALALRPNDPGILTAIAGVHQLRGELAEARVLLQQAIEIQPRFATAFSQMLFISNLDETLDEQARFDLHREFGNRYEATRPRPSGSPRHANGRIRIGFVSADLRDHAIANFLGPALAGLSRAKFEVFCYASVAEPDAVTEKIKSWCENWRDIGRTPDAQAADIIHQDEIEILVDLGGHAALSRLPIFMHRPARLQLSWLGYPNTTSLSCIDYRITDAIADPVGTTEHLHTEKLLRIDPPFICYEPPKEAPDVADSPCVKNGYVTFGTFSTYAKIRPPMLRFWVRLLQTIPNSRLVIKNRMMAEEDLRERIMSEFPAGVDPGRIELLASDATRAEHLARYGQIDIALDTFPYHGTTTTCEALWMGVPVLALLGKSHLSRVAGSLLGCVDLSHLVSADERHLLQQAMDLAKNPARLQSIRRGLRGKMAASALTDVAGFSRKIEQAFTAILANVT